MSNLSLSQPLDLGAKITAQRKALGVRAQSTAGAAGISRITLHRIERGETSVSLGAYLKVCKVLGLCLDIVAEGSGQSLQGAQAKNQARIEGSHIRIGDYPQLTALAWQLDIDALLSDEEAIGIYERNQRFLDKTQIDNPERDLMQRLITEKAMENLLD